MNCTMTKVTLLLAAAVVMAGCAQADPGEAQDGQSPQQWPQETIAAAPESPESPAAPSSAAPAEEQLQRTDPEAVIVAAAGELTTWYPVTERNRGASTVRAARWLEPRLVNETPQLRPDAQWMEWAQAGATISSRVKVAEEEHPPDSDTQVTRAVVVEQTMHSPSGEKAVEPALAMWLTCSKGDDGLWRVSEFRF
ncbi:hypothetical protein [Dietzia cercidiphylli]|jgi:hypothetical protein|uniref:hypothetical protein n=1 Tax=Dietzia cercidiphylli TaxID=498199 RepID=UPI00223B95C0|nr:hypothetical protein [Dietzia cercidiphylli]MCT1515310.1 hypothetical protein [Dietzia cercidiphylli]